MAGPVLTDPMGKWGATPAVEILEQGVEGGIVAAPSGSTVWGRATNLADNQINSAADRVFPSWDLGTADLRGVGFDGTSWTIQTAGDYRFHALIVQERLAGGARMSVAIQLALNGAVRGPTANTGYIRNTSGHIRSSTDLTDVIAGLAVGDHVSMVTRRDSSPAAAVAALAGLGVFIIEKI